MEDIHNNKIDFSKVRLRRRALKDLKDNSPKPIMGLDTETLHGYAKLICDSEGNSTYLKSIGDCLNFLTSNRFRTTTNFFYNIQYDFDAVMKYLSQEDLQVLVKDCKIEIYGYTIKYIPKKMFTITRNGNSYRFFDLAQFYEMSLEKAARLYTKLFKNEDNLDRARIGMEPQYWLDHEHEILKYCIQDCKITSDLGEVLQKELIHTTGHAPKGYISQAGISKDYFRRRCHLPDIRKIPHHAKYYAFQAYHGGRFEVTERGSVGEVTALDINSAYPYQIANLIDINEGDWKRVSVLNRDAHYGFYLASVKISYTHLPPLAMNAYGTVIFPCGEWTAYFTKDELEALDGIGEYTIIGGTEFYPDKIVYPFKEAIEALYGKKKITPKNSYEYALYKKIMNSLYGCFYEKIKQPDGSLKAGLLFNPIYASIITANTRLQLWQEARKYGKRCVSMATDGLLIRGDHTRDDNKELGEWGFDGVDDAIILRSGIYSMGEVMKQRCVIKADVYYTPHGDFKNLFDYINKYPDMKKYPVLNQRPLHMRECIVHHKAHTKEDINIFVKSELAFDLNTDVKRIFEKTDITGRQLLEGKIASNPWMWKAGEM